MSIGQEKYVPEFLDRADKETAQKLDAAGLRYKAAENAYEQRTLDGIFRKSVEPITPFFGRDVRVESDWHYAFRDTLGGYEPLDLAIEGYVPGIFDFMYIGTFTDPTTRIEVTLLSVGLTVEFPELYEGESLKLLTPVSYVTDMALTTGADLN
jgi:hypothetical protein